MHLTVLYNSIHTILFKIYLSKELLAWTFSNQKKSDCPCDPDNACLVSVALKITESKTSKISYWNIWLQTKRNQGKFDFGLSMMGMFTIKCVNGFWFLILKYSHSICFCVCVFFSNNAASLTTDLGHHGCLGTELCCHHTLVGSLAAKIHQEFVAMDWLPWPGLPLSEAEMLQAISHKQDPLFSAYILTV